MREAFPGSSQKAGGIECTCFVLCSIPLFVLVFVITQR